MRWLACLVVVYGVTGCWRSAPPPRTSPIETSRTRPGRPSPPPDRSDALYALDEALADAFSGPWTFVGTGEWFGMFQVNACVYRNARVFIVYKYCTLKEKRAFGVVVLSPTRGRVFIYAEGDRPISTTRRRDWITFKAESHVVAGDPLRLDFTYAELRAWDERRYYLHAPACFGGVEINRPQKGCLKLDSQIEVWHARNKGFLAAPNDDWYRIVTELRRRATSDARPYRGP